MPYPKPANPAVDEIVTTCRERCLFLNPRPHDFYPDWERAANDGVALLSAEAGRNPTDRDLTDLIGELSTRSEEFRTHWAAHNVRLHQTGAKRFHHPVVGELTLTFEMMELAADRGLNPLRRFRVPCNSGAPAVIARSGGALLLSCTQASVAEFRRQTLALDDPRERRRLACRRLLRPGRSGSAVALPLVPAVAVDQSRSPALGRPPADREGRDQRARGAS